MITRWEELANAIVRKAAIDYKNALIAMKEEAPPEETEEEKKDREERVVEAHKTVIECEDFFNSKWYGILTDLNAEILMEMIRDEVE